VLAHLHTDNGADIERSVLAALASPSGSATGLCLVLGRQSLPVERLDDREAPDALGFVREPQP